MYRKMMKKFTFTLLILLNLNIYTYFSLDRIFEHKNTNYFSEFQYNTTA